MAQNVVAFNTEKVVTGTKQVLQLQEVTEVTTSIPEISNPKTCQDLSYEFLQDKEITSRAIDCGQVEASDGNIWIGCRMRAARSG